MAGSVSNYTWKWFSGCQFITAVHREQIMKSREHAIKPLLHKQWISSRSRARETGKKDPTIHPQSHRVYLALSCSWIQSSQGSLHNPRQDIHYSHKPPSQQNRRARLNERAAISSGSDFMLEATFPRLWKPVPPTPTLTFPLSLLFFPSMSTHKRDCMQKVAIRVLHHEIQRGVG